MYWKARKQEERYEQLSFEFKEEKPLLEYGSNIGLKRLRAYQAEVLSVALEENTIVSLPTGTGKTLVAFYFMENAVKGGKALFLCPTNVLAKQQFTRFPSEDKTLITARKRRTAEDYSSTYIFGTPQTILNDLRAGILSKENIDVIVFDECHRAVGDYAYVRIARGFNGRVLGLTASLGSDTEKMLNICENLNVSKIVHKEGEEVFAFVGKARVVPHFVTFPHEYFDALSNIRRELSRLRANLEMELSKIGFEFKDSKKELLALEKKLSNGGWEVKEARNAYWKYRWLYDLVDLLERYSITEFFNALGLLWDKESKNAKALLSKHLPKEALEALRGINTLGMEHPKASVLRSMAQDGVKSIVFTSRRENAYILKRELEDAGIACGVLLGKGDGVTSKMQLEAISRFRANEFNVLISTSVGEEGLDLPSVGRVVFYDEVPRAIRSIQRKGRTARISEGEVVQLIAKGTLDELFYYISKRREKAMAKRIAEVNAELQRRRLNSRL